MQPWTRWLRHAAPTSGYPRHTRPTAWMSWRVLPACYPSPRVTDRGGSLRTEPISISLVLRPLPAGQVHQRMTACRWLPTYPVGKGRTYETRKTKNEIRYPFSAFLISRNWNLFVLFLIVTKSLHFLGDHVFLTFKECLQNERRAIFCSMCHAWMLQKFKDVISIFSCRWRV